MTTFLTYILTSGILLAILHLLYKLTLSRLTFFTFNRWAILSIYAISFLAFPAAGLIKSLFADNSTAAVAVTESELPELVVTQIPAMPATPVLPREGIEAIIALYFLGVAVCVVLTVITLFHIIKVMKKGKRIAETDLIITEDSTLAPFSIAGNIIINKEDLSSDCIAIHERYHLEGRHWIDLIIAQAAIALQWFNPAAWLLRDEMRDVHEYAADRAVAAAGFDIREYQLTLIRKAAGKKFAALANCLNHSKTKKRITMMIKKDSRRSAQLRALAAIPVVAIALWSVNTEAVASALTPMEKDSVSSVGKISEKTTAGQMRHNVPASTAGAYASILPAATEAPTAEPAATQTAQTGIADAKSPAISAEASELPMATSDKEEKIHLAIDKIAEYPGGQMELIKFLSDNTKYPEEAIKNNESGRVVVSFDIDKDGTVSNPRVLKGVSKSLDSEAVRLVNMMPKWEPAQVDGKAVKSRFTLPVSFKLTEPDPEPKAE